MTRATHSYIIKTMSGAIVTAVNSSESHIRDIEKSITRELGQRVRAHSC